MPRPAPTRSAGSGSTGSHAATAIISARTARSRRRSASSIPTDREQETEVALAALAGCINAVVTVSAAERGIDLASLRTDIAISWDPAVFLHLRDTEEHGKPVDQFEGFTVTLAVSGRCLDRGDIEFLRKTVRRSAVFNLFTLARKARVEVERIERAWKRRREPCGSRHKCVGSRT
jgi:hypothetical protein